MNTSVGQLIQNFILILRSSVRSFGWVYPISDTIITGIWVVSLLTFILTLGLGIVSGNFLILLEVSIFPLVLVILLLFSALPALRKFYVWVRLLINSKTDVGRVIEVSQFYSYYPLLNGYSADPRNSFSLLSIDLHGKKIQCIFLNRNRQFDDLLGKEVAIKISNSNPNIFRVLSHADGTKIRSEEYVSFSQSNRLIIGAILAVIVIGGIYTIAYYYFLIL